MLRYQVLDRCFSDFKRKYEIDDLVDKVNEVLYDLNGTEVKLRQIWDDIKYMRDRMTYNAPIKAYRYQGKRCYYRYADPSFSIFNNELSTEEVAKLRSTIEMLSRFRNGTSNAWLEEVISHLECRFGIKENTDNAVSFEQNSQLKGLEFLSELIDATIHHQPLNVFYRSYYGVDHYTIVHPYHLKQYNNRWFLLGLEETEHGNRLTNKALDRIVRFDKANVAFVPNNAINFQNYFKDIVGVTIPKEHPQPERILLKFDTARFPYIVSKPIHSTQKIINDNEGLVEVCLRPNKEFEAMLLSFGPQIEVLAPEWLRTQIQEKIEAALNKYKSLHNGCTE